MCGLNSKGLMTLEALVSLIVIVLVIAMLPRFNPNIDLAIAYKEGSDVSLAIIESNALGDNLKEKRILEKTNPNLQMKIISNGIEREIKWNNPKTRFVITRPIFEKRMKEVVFVFGY